MTKEHLVAAAYLTAGLAAGCCAAIQNADFFHDDAYISLRYAWNLASGVGLEWNDGEPVEGYTNFLHVLATAALAIVGSPPVAAARLVNCAGLILTVGAVLYGALALVPGALRWPTAGGLAGLVLGCFPLVVWTLGGLEGPLFCGLLSAGGVLLVLVFEGARSDRALVPASVCLVLAAMTRPEGALIYVAALLLTVGSRRRFFAFVLPGALIVTPWLLWKWAYYGSIVPNTFYAKAVGVGGGQILSGLHYVWAFASTGPFLPLAAVAGLGVLAVRGRFGRAAVFLVIWLVAAVCYLASVGGDHMPAFRLCLLLVPACLLTLLLGARAAADGSRHRDAHACLIALLVLGWLQIGSPRMNPQKEDAAAYVGTIIGEYVAREWPAGSLIALNTAGSTPFHALQHRFIDMLGLNDATIARRQIRSFRLRRQAVPGHSKGDGRYVLSRQPDYLILGPASGTVAERPWFLSDLEIAEAPAFRRDYVQRRVRIDVRSRADFFRYGATRSGVLWFLYYERRR